MAGCENGKRLKKSGCFDGEDKISNLPEGVLCRILSLLSMKEAVRTSILGTKWTDLWATVHNLEFDFKSMYNPNCENAKDKLEKFMNFVDRGFNLRNGLNINKCTVSCFEICDFSRIVPWICNVITCNVKELDIRMSVHPDGLLPQTLFTCKTLVVLKLSGSFVLNVPTDVCFLSLKILHLRSLVYLDDASIEKLFSSCPVLEELDVIRCDWDNIGSFNVSVPSLRRLSLSFRAKKLEFFKVHRRKIIVDTPNLEYLKLQDHISDDCMFNDLSCVVEADIDVKRSWMTDHNYSIFAKRILELLTKITTVKVLSLSTSTLWFLWHVRDQNIPTFRNLVNLKLGVDVSYGWRLLPNLLVSSPNLEVLLFEQGLVFVKNPDQHHNQFRSMPPEVPSCLLMHLKAIEIRKLVGKIDELKLIKYFLKNAKVLEKMTIRCHCQNVVWNVRERLLTIRDAIWWCPWGSSSCQLKFII